MTRKLTALNILLVLALFLLLGWGGLTWLQPKFPASVDGDGVAQVSRELKIPVLSRQPYSNSIVKDISHLNLFRKQRRKHYRPKPPKPKPKPRINKNAPQVALAPSPPPPPPKPITPPPQLVLTGVMLFNDHKVAIFEGTYSEIRGGRLVQNLKPRRRGYKIGEALGDYKIETIDKSHATLSAINGGNLTLTISKTSPTEKIQKAGGNLIRKSKPVSNSFPRKAPTRKSRIQKNGNNGASPPATPPPAVSTPGSRIPIPNTLSPKRLQQLRQKAMGF